METQLNMHFAQEISKEVTYYLTVEGRDYVYIVPDNPINIMEIARFCSFMNYIKRGNPYSFVEFNIQESFLGRLLTALLLGSYEVLHRGIDLSDVLSEFNALKLISSEDPDDYKVQYWDVLNQLITLKRASTVRLFDINDFNCSDYTKYSKSRYGDMNWIVPQKILAFASPASQFPWTNNKNHPPYFYFEYFENNGVTDIIQLNDQYYVPNEFIAAGYRHHLMYFDDGCAPPMKLFTYFLWVVDNAKGAVAIHCKAGLGRTGTLIAAYLMRCYRFSANEAVAWIRLCRPGSINQLQKHWLQRKESFIWYMGNEDRLRLSSNRDHIPRHKHGIYSTNTVVYNRDAILKYGLKVPMDKPWEEKNELRVQVKDTSFAERFLSLISPFDQLDSKDCKSSNYDEWLGKLRRANANFSLESLAPGYEKLKASSVFHPFPEVYYYNFSEESSSTSIITYPITNVFPNNSSSSISSYISTNPYSLFSTDEEIISRSNNAVAPESSGLTQSLQQMHLLEFPCYSLFGDPNDSVRNSDNHTNTPTNPSNSHVNVEQPSSSGQPLQGTSKNASYSSVVAETPTSQQKFQSKPKKRLSDQRPVQSSSNNNPRFPPFLLPADNLQRSIVDEESGTSDGTREENKDKQKDKNSNPPLLGDDEGKKKRKKKKKSKKSPSQ